VVFAIKIIVYIQELSYNRNMTRRIYVQESSIEGKGVFASQDFKRGDIIFILKGERYYHINNGKKDTFAHPNWVGIDKNTWIDPKGNFQYINHSCNPNMGIKGKVTFVALRNIRKGEELTFDYSVTEEDTSWVMKNLEKKCPGYRIEIRSIQSLPEVTYKKYLPYVPTYFQKVYTSYKNIK
jgi:SET domain-containing protein